MDISIGGFQALSNLDYPGRLASVIYCQGCAWRCRYCVSPELMCLEAEPTHSWREIQEFLLCRRGLIDAVVFSGGEPTLQTDLPQCIDWIKAQNFDVALHTAGVSPEMLRRALPKVDWVAFDIKALPEHSDRITQTAKSGAKNWQSLDVLLEEGTAYEVRFTLHSQLHDRDVTERLMQRLRERGVTHFALQWARNGPFNDKALEWSQTDTDQFEYLNGIGQQLFESFTMQR